MAAVQMALYLAALVSAMDGVAPQDHLAVAETANAFFWNYQSPAGNFNASTYAVVSASLQPGSYPRTMSLSAGSGFPNAYTATMTGITYWLGPDDTAKQQQAMSRMAALAAQAVGTYLASFGPIPPSQAEAAGFANPFDYLLGAIVAGQWSGATPPLSLATMAAAPSLAALLPNAAAGAGPTIVVVQCYLAQMTVSQALSQQRSNGQWLRGTALANAKAPTLATGGMTLVVPESNQAVPGYVDAYDIGLAPWQIAMALADSQRVMSVQVSLPPGGGGVQFQPVGAPSAAAPTGPVSAVTLTYTGYALVPIVPRAFSPVTSAGWFTTVPIAQAVANQPNPDATGYHYVGTPACNAGPGGNCGWLRELMVANPPVVELTYAKAADLPPLAGQGTLTLFGGLKPGGGRVLYAVRPALSPSYASLTVPAGGATRTIRLVPVQAMVPPMMATADILGVAVGWPGAPSP